MTVSGFFSPLLEPEYAYIRQCCEKGDVKVRMLDPEKFFVKLLKKELKDLPVKVETADTPEGELLRGKGAETLDDLRDACAYSRARIMDSNRILKKLIRPMMSPKRYAHSLSVAETAEKLAREHGYDPERAYRAGLLHDIMKSCSEEENDAILRRCDPAKLTAPPQIKHGYSAPYYLKEVCHYDDPEVLNAIYHHSDGEAPDVLSKILFIADKREPLRGLDDNIIEVSMKDLDEGFRLLVRDVERYLEERYGITGLH